MKTEQDMQLTSKAFMWEQGVSHEQVNMFSSHPNKAVHKTS